MLRYKRSITTLQFEFSEHYEERGHISLLRETDDVDDVLYASDADGNIDKTKSIRVEKGILNDVTEREVTAEGETVAYDFLQVSGPPSNAKPLFEFMANNTNIEIGLTVMNDERSFISTSHEPFRTAGLVGIRKNAELNIKIENIAEETHSHPLGVHDPSGRTVSDEKSSGDILGAQLLEKINPGIKFSIYTPSDGVYTSYSGKTTRPPLPEVIVAPTRPHVPGRPARY
jgi:hypothetical protein